MVEPSDLQVVLMGMITVFICLIILIFMIIIMSKVINAFSAKNEAETAVQEERKDHSDKVENQRIVAAISAAIAENLNKDVSQIRIHSIKRL
ncbi:OadG family transporter subunit [Lacrimispora sp.]|uniref:OadG family transporter subunit n=1 Tax=Lacrimispora sp. TaxID=2719234 RepID=UPI00345FDD09